MADFRKLRVWHAAHQLAVDSDKVCGRLRGRPRPRLISQLTGAALSVSGNISEGREHRSQKEFARFLGYSLSSASELESHIQFARDVGAMTDADFALLQSQLVEVRKMLHRLLKKVKDDADD